MTSRCSSCHLRDRIYTSYDREEARDGHADGPMHSVHGATGPGRPGLHRRSEKSVASAVESVRSSAVRQSSGRVKKCANSIQTYKPLRCPLKVHVTKTPAGTAWLGSGSGWRGSGRIGTRDGAEKWTRCSRRLIGDGKRDSTRCSAHLEQ